MKNQSALSDLKPWNTSQTQPLNILKIQSYDLSKNQHQKSFKRPTTDAQRINAQRRKNLSQANEQSRYKPKSTTFNFQYRQSQTRGNKRVAFTSSKIEKLLEKSQTTPVKTTQLSTEIAKSELGQTDSSTKFTPYNSPPANGLLQFTNTAIQELRNKNNLMNKKVSFSQFMDLKRKEGKYKKYPKRTDAANWPDLSTTIHVKHSPKQCISILEKQPKMNSFHQYLSEDKHFEVPLRHKKDRRKLVSTKKCSSFKVSLNSQPQNLTLGEQLKSFSLILPN